MELDYRQVADEVSKENSSLWKTAIELLGEAAIRGLIENQIEKANSVMPEPPVVDSEEDPDAVSVRFHKFVCKTILGAAVVYELEREVEKIWFTKIPKPVADLITEAISINEEAHISICDGLEYSSETFLGAWEKYASQ